MLDEVEVGVGGVGAISVSIKVSVSCTNEKKCCAPVSSASPCRTGGSHQWFAAGI
jgi:hypothetical protein